MWIDAISSSNLVFECFLFLLFVLGFSYGMRYYILPMLRSGMQNSLEHIHDIRSQQELLTQLAERIHHEEREQEACLDSLKQKLYIWHQARLQKQRELLHYKKKNIALLDAKKNQQQEVLHAIQLRQAALEPALKQAQQQLETAYAGSTGKKLLRELVDALAHKTKQ